ncbi:MAG TPA: hypothetical protein VFL55_13970 [Acetobacteraceae bacterium]|nr:hypothetical protein [Acetobacteraceae bacterium]
MSYYDGWVPYVPVAERRRRAARELAKLARKGQPVSPVVIAGRAITTTFWGKAWGDNLESYRDLANRLSRGRTYVRNGSVLDLQIAPSEVAAMVSGTSLYRVKVQIDPLPRARWQSICKDCAGSIDSLVELLQGRLSQRVMQRICHQGLGLFPDPQQIRFDCSCPDYASMSSTWRPCCTASARDWIISQNCCFGCVPLTREICWPESTRPSRRRPQPREPPRC